MIVNSAWRLLSAARFGLSFIVAAQGALPVLMTSKKGDHIANNSSATC
jgi:hypothetical protein